MTVGTSNLSPERSAGPIRWLASLVVGLEQLPLGFGTLFGMLVGIITVRNLLEIVVVQNPAYSALAGLVHYPLAYVGPYLALILVLSAWSGVRPLFVTRLMTLAWLLTLVPPLVDLALTRRRDIRGIGYLHTEPADLSWVYLHFFDPAASFIGTTPGIRVETAIAVLLGAAYVLLRSRSWLRSIGAAFSVYVVSLGFFTLPVLVLAVLRVWVRGWTRSQFLWEEGLLFRPVGKGNEDSIAILWLVPLILVLLLAWRALERRASRPDRTDWSLGHSALPGAAALLAMAFVAGIGSSVSLSPPRVTITVVPYDFLAPLGAALAIGLMATAIGRQSSADVRITIALALAALALITGLRTTFALGALAATAPLLLIVPESIPSWLRRLLTPPGLALCTVAAFASGWALHRGPEAFARLPPTLSLPPLLAGLAMGVLLASGVSAPGWAPPVLFGVVFLIAFLPMGSPVLAGFAAGIAAVAGAFGILADRSLERRSAGLFTTSLLGLALCIGVIGAVRSENVGVRLARAVDCVARLHVVAGQRERDQGNLPTARSWFEKALECQPENVAARRGLAGVLIEKEHTLNDGIEILERLVREHLGGAQDLSNLAAAYVKAGRLSEALPRVEEAVALEPRNLKARFNLAAILQELGRSDDARKAWDEYLELTEGRPEHAESVNEARRRLRRLKI